MRKFNNKFRACGCLIYRWVNPLLDSFRSMEAVPRYIGFFRDWVKYSKLNGAETIGILNTYPCIHDKMQTTGFDMHYFYQDIWAFKKIYESKVDYHVDVGSRIGFVGFLTAITKVTFIDIRPLVTTLENFDSRKGNILSMPFDDNSMLSLSCLEMVN